MSYLTEQRSGFRLYFEECDRAEAEVACTALEIALDYNRMHWGLAVPDNLHMVIMTSWWSYMMAAAPTGYKIYLTMLYPLWARRLNRTWKFAGGWQNRFGRRRVVGIKPPRLIEAADRSLGRQVYVEVKDLIVKMRHMVYHEVTHACTAHLRLPAWFNEGIAMLTVDGIVGEQTVLHTTLQALGRSANDMKGVIVHKLDPSSLIAHYVRGYWITRFYKETQPGLLQGLLQRPIGRVQIERGLAQAVGLPRERFWAEIEGLVKSHFRENSAV